MTRTKPQTRCAQTATQEWNPRGLFAGAAILEIESKNQPIHHDEKARGHGKKSGANPVGKELIGGLIHRKSINENRARKEIGRGFEILGRSPRDLTLGELEAATGALAAIFFAFFDARVARQSADFAQAAAQFLVGKHESFGNAVFNGSGLAGIAAAGRGRFDVELDFGGDAQNAANQLLRGDAREVFFDCFAVDGDGAATGRNPHAGNRVFALAGAVKSVCHDFEVVRWLDCWVVVNNLTTHQPKITVRFPPLRGFAGFAPRAGA